MATDSCFSSSLQHGGVVLLYHPCAKEDTINRLRSLAKSCLRRYVISPSELLEPQNQVRWELTGFPGLISFPSYIHFVLVIYSVANLGINKDKRPLSGLFGTYYCLNTKLFIN